MLSQFIFGLHDWAIRSKLLVMPGLELDAAIQEVLLQESIAAASKRTETTISALQRPRRKHSCGKTDHLRNSCKFCDAECRRCGRKGHISIACRSESTANAIVEDLSDGSLHARDTKMVLRISGADDNLWRESCILFNRSIEFLIDTGSQVTLIPSSHIEGLDV